MNENIIKKASDLIDARNSIDDELQQLAYTINPTKPWKRVLREDLHLVI